MISHIICFILLFITQTVRSEVVIEVGKYLEDIPGYAMLQGFPARSEVTLEMVIEAVRGPFGTFNTTVFREPGGDTFLFGPTVRVQRGQTMRHTIVNRLLVSNPNASSPYPNVWMANNTDGKHGFFNGDSTNLHLHGLHGSPGQLSQPIGDRMGSIAVDQYTGGDNIFLSLPSLESADAEPSRVTLENYVPEDHLPGIHWAHPHRFGGSYIQTAASNAVWIVEDEDAWLPDDAGCKPLKTLLNTAPEQILHISKFEFGVPAAIAFDLGAGATDGLSADAITELALNGSNPDFTGAMAMEGNMQFMYNATQPTIEGLVIGNVTTEDYALINSAWQPIMRMRPGAWQRWRIVNTSPDSLMALTLTEWPTKNGNESNNGNNTNNTSTNSTNTDPLRCPDRAPCEMMLVAKDGIFMQEIPRLVPDLFLSPAATTDVLVRCFGDVGSRISLSAGMSPDFSGRNCSGAAISVGSVADADTAEDPGRDYVSASSSYNFQQRVMMVVELEAYAPGVGDGSAADGAAAKLEDSCTPLRPTYAADLRQEALDAANITDLLSVNLKIIDHMGPCTIGNGTWFEFPSPSPITMPVGRIVNITTRGLAWHALHTHVNPFMLAELPENALIPGYEYTPFFRIGDYHDTLNIPQINENAHLVLRAQPTDFGGYGVVHCHILNHEDGGCMGVLKFECPDAQGANDQPLRCAVEPELKGTFTTYAAYNESTSDGITSGVDGNGASVEPTSSAFRVLYSNALPVSVLLVLAACANTFF